MRALRFLRASGPLILGASLTRVGYGLVFALLVPGALSSAESRDVFQMLYVQGALVSLLAASAYARSVNLSAQGLLTRAVVAGYHKFLTLGIVLGAIALWVFIAPEASLWVRLACSSLLSLGAAATAYSGFAQGCLVGSGGLFGKAFGPVLYINLAFCILVLPLLWVNASLMWVVGAWVAPQVLVAISVHRAIVGFLRSVTGHSAVRPGGDVVVRNYLGATGAVNCASVMVAFNYRERWAISQGSGVASLGFLGTRVTELGYQMVYMGLSSAPGFVTHVFGFFTRVRRFWVVLSVGLGLVSLGLAPLALPERWSWMNFMAAELFVMPVRFFGMIFLLVLLSRRSVLLYVLAVGLSTLVTLSCLYVPVVQTDTYGLQAMQATGAIPLFCIIAHLLRESAREGRR